MKKFTRATLKKFIKDNSERLYIRVDSKFDGMTDCVEQSTDKSLKKVNSEKIDFTNNYSFGIDGLYLVGGSRNLFTLDKNKVEVWNCCGSCTLIAI